MILTTITIMMATWMIMMMLLLKGILVVTIIMMVIMIMTVTMIMILFRWPQFLDASQFFNRIRRGRTSILDPFASSSKKDA